MKTETLLRTIREQLEDADLLGSFLVRDLRTGEEIGIEPDVEFAAASLVKVPLAVVTLDRIRKGELDGSEELPVRPGVDVVRGAVGIGQFRHPVRVALEDLVYLSVVISDNSAADMLFARTPPADVATALQSFGLHGIRVRHTLGDLMETPQEQLPPEDAHLAHMLAIQAGTAGRGHSVPQLDVTRANAGSARAYVNLLEALWLPSAIPETVTGRVRELMASNMHRQRLTPDFDADASPWAAKTGSLLNLRHEIGVVEHSDGQLFAVAALTESRVPALVQPETEALMGQIARRLRDQLRARGWSIRRRGGCVPCPDGSGLEFFRAGARPGPSFPEVPFCDSPGSVFGSVGWNTGAGCCRPRGVRPVRARRAARAPGGRRRHRARRGVRVRRRRTAGFPGHGGRRNSRDGSVTNGPWPDMNSRREAVTDCPVGRSRTTVSVDETVR